MFASLTSTLATTKHNLASANRTVAADNAKIKGLDKKLTTSRAETVSAQNAASTAQNNAASYAGAAQTAYQTGYTDGYNVGYTDGWYGYTYNP